MKAKPVESKTALVTGCSTGIGLATAHLLKERGWTVLPTARKERDIDQLRSAGFTPILLDVADGASVRRAAAEALDVTGGKLGALVNNAGFGQPGAMEDLTRDAMRYQFEVNVFGLQELTNRFVPVFRRQGYGRIVNVSSVLGRVTLPFMGIYSASKYAVESMSDALRCELGGTGITVSIVEPGPIATEFSANSRARARSQIDINTVQSPFVEKYRKRLSDDDGEDRKPSRLFTRPPEAVARKILHALESACPHRRYPVTAITWIMAFMRRFAPDAVVDRIMSSQLA